MCGASANPLGTHDREPDWDAPGGAVLGSYSITSAS